MAHTSSSADPLPQPPRGLETLPGSRCQQFVRQGSSARDRALPSLSVCTESPPLTPTFTFCPGGALPRPASRPPALRPEPSSHQLLPKLVLTLEAASGHASVSSHPRRQKQVPERGRICQAPRVSSSPRPCPSPREGPAGAKQGLEQPGPALSLLAFCQRAVRPKLAPTLVEVAPAAAAGTGRPSGGETWGFCRAQQFHSGDVPSRLETYVLAETCT